MSDQHVKQMLPRRSFLAGMLVAPVTLSMARAAPSVRPVINLQDWGELDKTGAHDATAVLRKAAGQVPKGGATLLLPMGQFRLSGTVFLQPGTWLQGRGLDTTLLPIPIQEGFTSFKVDSDTGTHKEYSLFVNVQTRDASVTNADFRFSDLRLGPEPGPSRDTPAGRRPDFWGGHLIRLHRARDVLIERCHFRNTNDGVALTDCSQTKIVGCTAVNAVNVAFDHWFGGSGHTVRQCVVDGCGTGVMVTGAGTDGQNGQQVETLIERVRITGAAQAAIIANCLTVGSSVDYLKVLHSEIRGGGIVADDKAGIYAGGVVGQGNIRRALIERNRFVELSGVPIVFQAENYGQQKQLGSPPSDCTFEGNVFENCQPVNAAGKAAPLMIVRGPRQTLRENRSVFGVYDFAAEVDDATDVLEFNTIPVGCSGLYQTHGVAPRIVAR